MPNTRRCVHTLCIRIWLWPNISFYAYMGHFARALCTYIFRYFGLIPHDPINLSLYLENKYFQCYFLCNSFRFNLKGNENFIKCGHYWYISTHIRRDIFILWQPRGLETMSEQRFPWFFSIIMKMHNTHNRTVDVFLCVQKIYMKDSTVCVYHIYSCNNVRIERLHQ